MTPTAVRRARHYLQVNGWRWTALHVLGRVAGRLARDAEERSRELERRHGLPGTNSIERNRAVWARHDWSSGGEEWSESVEWRESVVGAFLAPHVPVGAAVLEIGPGAGRWTGYLQERARSLCLLDITDVTLKICADRLAGRAPRPTLVLGDGRSLAGVPEDLDVVWSFDVFVHIAPADQRSYLGEIARVLRPGGTAIVHHGAAGGSGGGWRSSMTGTLFEEYARAAGLTPVETVAEWTVDGVTHRPSTVGDVVSVLRR